MHGSDRREGVKPGICPHLDFWKNVLIREREKEMNIITRN
jgi:hypothetical protein